MPELPEVETVRRGLTALIVPATIQQVEVYWDKIITPAGSSDVFKRSLIGETVKQITRRGKYLVFHFEKWAMISHLRMEGKFSVVAQNVPFEKHTHVVFDLTDGRQLRYLDVRKFGRMTLIPAEQLETYLQALPLGPEPTKTDFLFDVFRRQLSAKHQMIKPLLLSQKMVAGIGNIYADEILFRAKILPTRLSDSLTDDEVQQLHGMIIQVLEEAVQAGGSTIRTYKNSLGKPGFFQQQLQVYGRQNQPCVCCQHLIEKIKVAQRGTHFCPICQH